MGKVLTQVVGIYTVGTNRDTGQHCLPEQLWLTFVTRHQEHRDQLQVRDPEEGPCSSPTWKSALPLSPLQFALLETSDVPIPRYLSAPTSRCNDSRY